MDKLAKYHPLVLFSLITFIATLWMILLNYSEFSTAEVLVFCLYIFAITFLQICIIGTALLLEKRQAKYAWLTGVLATLFTSFNIYSLIIVHNSRFTALESLPLALFIAGQTLVIAAVFFIRQKEFVKFTHVFALIMAGMIGVQVLADSNVSIKGLFDKIPSHFSEVKFKKTPNIYVVSFDALVPEKVAKQNIGAETVPYLDTIKRYDMRIIPNSFAERIPTKRAMNLLLAMDKQYFDTVSEDAGFVRDEVPNPTYEIFRSNGYKIQFLYENGYFGDDRGRLDYYGIAEVYGLCRHVERKYSFMGYCLPSIQDKVKSFTKIKQASYPQLLFDRIKETAKFGEPWFTYASIYLPGHAKNSTKYNKEEDWDLYRSQYTRRAERAAVSLDELLSTIREHDPESVTVIFGDHGSLLTLGALDDYTGIAAEALAYDPAELPEDSPVSFAQVVQDRHAVLTAIMPADYCSSEFRHEPYSTMRIMRDLMICLSEGQDPLPAEFQSDDNRWKPYVYD